jgi:hypothetical protein
MNKFIALIALSICAGSFAAAAADQAAPTARLGGISINVSDLDKATAYYKLVGLVVDERRGQAPKRTQYMNIDVGTTTFKNPGLVLRETTDALDLGNAYNVIILLTSDPAAVCKKLADANMPCTREAGAEGPSKIITAFAKDPDGHVVEFLQPRQ